MRLHPLLQEATFLARLNRFAAVMACGGQEVMVHIANSGRLKELLDPMNPMLLAPAPPGSHRKTAYDLALVEIKGALVSADARLPNVLLREAIETDRLPGFADYDSIRQEVTFGDSRIDLLLSRQSGLCYIEAKSVTLVENGVALFPDASTKRGRKHLRSLEKAVGQGHRAAVTFIIQRSDANSFAPSEMADPEFCRTLRDVVTNGVEVYAYTCQVSRTQIVLSKAVPVLSSETGSVWR